MPTVIADSEGVTKPLGHSLRDLSTWSAPFDSLVAQAPT